MVLREKVKIIIDSMVFDKLIELSSLEITELRKKCELMTTNLSLKELNRIKDQAKKEKIFNFIKDLSISEVDAGIFAFGSYKSEKADDSDVGFSRYGELSSKGRFLRYQDAKILNEIKYEKQKKAKGKTSAFNDIAIALALGNYPDAVFVTDESRFRNGLKRCNKNAISFDEFKNRFLVEVL